MRSWKTPCLAFGISLLLACGSDEPTKQSAPAPFRPGDSVDVDGDGTTDGRAVDEDGDGTPDGLDTDGDGDVDAPLPDPPSDPSGGGDGDGDGDEDGVCMEDTVRSERATPDILIVLDRSGSMLDDEEGVDRWNPSVAALKAVTEALEGSVRFGLMAFPGTDGGGGRGDDDENECAPGSLVVPIALENAAEIAQELDAMDPGGRTPTAATLEAAHQFLGERDLDPDQMTAAPQYVLLVTDGAPNCSGGDRGGGGGGGGEPEAVQASVAAITAMAQDGIPTYVIGYDARSEPELNDALNMMAAAGGTGDTEHRPVEDEASLVRTFEEIASGVVSCTFVLEEAPPDPSYVRVLVDGEQISLNQPDGWTISADHTTVTVQGAACERLHGSAALTVEVLCEVVDIF